MNLSNPDEPLERRKRTQSEPQRFAAAENFTLYLLGCIRTHIRNPRIKEIVSPAVADTIYLCADQEIRRIKSDQEARKRSK